MSLVTFRTLNYNKDHDPASGRFSSGGGGKNTKWKPSGSKKEVDEFAKNSKYKDTLYHGTSTLSSDSIKSEGFNKDKTISKRMFGDAVYLITNKKEAAYYAQIAEKPNSNPNFYDESTLGDGAILEMKINVKNPYKSDNENFSYKVGSYAETKFGYDMFIWGKKNKKWKDADGFQDLPSEKYNKYTAEFTNELLKKHDAVINGNMVLVANPKNIMVIK